MFDFDAAILIKSNMIQKDGIKETPEEELARLRTQFAAIGYGEH